MTYHFKKIVTNHTYNLQHHNNQYIVNTLSLRRALIIIYTPQPEQFLHTNIH